MVLSSGSKVSFANQINELESSQGTCRDPEELNRRTTVHWSSVVGEPRNLESPAWVWKACKFVFSIVQSWTYKVMTVIFGIPIAIILALNFAFLGFIQIWMLNPINKFFQVAFSSIRTFIEIILNAILSPFCETIGSCFSKFKVRHQRIYNMKDEQVFPFVI